MTVRLVIADAVTLVRLGYVSAVAAYPRISLVGQAGSVEEAVDVVDAVDPDVVSIDLAISDCAGLELAARLRRQRPRLGLVLTGPAEDGPLFEALTGGLSAYLPRSAPIEQLMSAVCHAAAAPASFTAPNLAAALARRRARATALSPREEQILHQLRGGDSLGVIAARMSLTESTVRTYVARLYDKLGAKTRAEALQAAAHRQLLRH